jgi:formiminoglutamate deiminase
VWCERALLRHGVSEGVTIEVADGRIAAVAAGTAPPAACEHRIGLTIPGAANTHSHAFHRALRHRSQVGRGSFWTWRDQMYRVAQRLDPERYHRLARGVFAEMVLAGYTSVGEFHYIHHQPDGTPYSEPNAMAEALTEAACQAGIRITLLDTLYLHGGLDAGRYQPVTVGQRRFSDRSFDQWADRAGRLAPTSQRRVGAAIHSVRAVDPGAIGEVARWAAESSMPLHAHVSEQPAENEQCDAAHGCTPIGLLARAGALGPSFTAVHATHLTDHDVALLGASGSSVCLCPTTERDLGDGLGPARQLADAGVHLAIGSDSHAVVDPLEEARAIELDERLARRERGLFDASELAAAMTAGHRSLGWDDAGAIAVGNRADLVTVSMDSLRTVGAHAGFELEATVFAATAADVTHVMIDGVNVAEREQHRTIDVVAELNAAIAEVVA